MSISSRINPQKSFSKMLVEVIYSTFFKSMIHSIFILPTFLTSLSQGLCQWERDNTSCYKGVKIKLIT